ncbi:MAG: DNA mismatch repair endonuclease MutL [Bacteroidota bacterium]
MNASKIECLPNHVISQIAAAEVVQRPATIVKELLENAIDAGSKAIKLLIKDGGKQSIQVIDDGEGMSSEDALRCFERHATSKISSLEDLFNIQTLGFRGEALASIVAVTQAELITKREEDEVGTHVIIHGGKVKSQTSVNAKKGTQIIVKNIFFNIPARRNFLKSTPTERKYIIEAFQKVAIAHPEIGLSYWQNDHQVYNLPPVKSAQRIVHLFGESYQKNLIPCQETTDRFSLQGYVGTPSHSKKTRGGQFLFVNNRCVKSAYIEHAIKKAFEGLIPPDTFPFYVLNVKVPPATLDVHVHPMKTEVKFEDESLIYTLVSAAVKKALAVHHITPSIDFGTNINESPLNLFTPIQERPANKGQNKKQDAYTQFQNRAEHAPAPPTNQPLIFTQPGEGIAGSVMKIESDANYGDKPLSKKPLLSKHPENRFFSLHNSYLFSSVKSGMLVVDLKAAYERILYERYQSCLTKSSNATQKLLFPVKTKVSVADFALIESCHSMIEKLGFRLEITAPDTVTFTAQPTEAQGQPLSSLIEELLEQYKATYNLDIQTQGDTWAKSLAKRIATYKKKKRLSQTESHALLDQLFACQNANYTPDGRRTWYMISVDTFTQFLFEQN